MTTSRVVMVTAAVVIVVAGMKAAATILVPFLRALFITILLSPILSWLCRKGLPTWMAMVIVTATIVVLGTSMATVVGTSVRDFTGDLPTYDASLREKVGLILDWLNGRGIETSRIQSSELLDVGAAMRLTATTLKGFSSLLTNGFLILMTVIFMLLEASTFPAKLAVLAERRPNGLIGFQDFCRSINRYMVIETAISLATGAIIVPQWE